MCAIRHISAGGGGSDTPGDISFATSAEGARAPSIHADWAEDAPPSLLIAAATAGQVPYAARLMGPQSAAQLTDAIIDLGHFKILKREQFERDVAAAEAARPGLIAALGASLSGTDGTRPSAGARAKILRVFIDYGLPYTAVGASIRRVKAKNDAAAMKAVRAELDLTERFIRERNQVEASIAASISGYLSDARPSAADIARMIADAADSGSYPMASLFDFADALARLPTISLGEEPVLGQVLYASGLRVEQDAASGRLEVGLRDRGQVPSERRPTLAPSALARLSAIPTPDLLRATTNELPRGALASARSDEFGTELHFPVRGQTALSGGAFDPTPSGEKVIVLYLHGSGRESSTGGSAGSLLLKLAGNGVVSLAPDLPEHGSGPTGRDIEDPAAFADWLHRQILEVRRRNPDAKIVLSGSCSGSLLALMYLAYHPEAADAAVLFGIGGRFTADVERQAARVMAGMVDEARDGSDAARVTNTRGLLWIDTLAKKFDPLASVPPNIPIHLILGRDDIVFPEGRIDAVTSALKAHYGDLFDVSVLTGLGHTTWEHSVADVAEAERQGLFVEMPGDPADTNLIHWAVVDFLRNRLGLESEVSVTSSAVAADGLSARQRAALLYNQNAAFRAVVGDTSVIVDEDGAARALASWEDAKATILDGILSDAIKNDAGFRQSYPVEVGEYLAAMRDGRKAARARHRLADALTRHLASAGSPAAHAPRNYWNPALLFDDVEASLAYRIGMISSRQEWRDREADDVPPKAKGPLHALFEGARRLYRALRGPSDSYRVVGDWMEGRLEFMADAQREVGISARAVLQIGNGHDLVLPFGLFADTRRVIMLSRTPFGSPSEIGRVFSSREMALAHMYSAAASGDTSFQTFKDGNSGGDLINRIMVGLGAKKILGIHYFAIDELGQKTYFGADPSTLSADAFQNAEVRFIGADGEERTLEVVRGNFIEPAVHVQRYLSSQSLDVAFAGHDATTFETSPVGLAFYYELIRRRDIPMVFLDRRRAINGFKRHTLYSSTYAFLDNRSIRTHSFYGHPFEWRPFPEGGRVHVARHTDFVNSWNYSNTIRWFEDYVQSQRLDRGGGFLPEPRTFQIFPAGMPHLMMQGAAAFAGGIMPMPTVLQPLPMMPQPLNPITPCTQITI